MKKLEVASRSAESVARRRGATWPSVIGEEVDN